MQENKFSIFFQKIEKEFYSPLTRLFLSRFKSTKLSEETILFFGYILEAFFLGHLCVKKEKGKISPDPSILFIKKDPASEEEELSLLREALSKEIDENSFVERVSSREEKNISKPFVNYKDYFFFQRNWFFENLFLELVHQRVHSSTLNVQEEKVSFFIDSLVNNNELTKEQAKAIKESFLHPFFMIFGGPGSGKSYLIFYIVWLWKKLFPVEDIRVLIAAPTGKAVKRIEELFKDKKLEVDISTLHSILKRKKNQPLYESNKVLDYNLIIIDETSMVDLQMMIELLKVLPLQSRLIFIGDPNQLPPIELGSVFSDLSLRKDFESVRYFLKKSHRFENLAWQEFFEELILGKSSFSDLIKKMSNVEFLSLKDFSKEEIMKRIIQESEPYFDFKERDPSVFFKKSNSFRILCGLKGREFGVEHLNESLFQYFCSKDKFNHLVPIMVTVNDYQLNVFNGTLGVGEVVNKEFSKGYFFSDEKQIEEIPLSLISSYELAYAMSVHKSQGSEYEAVILILPPGSEIFGKELLYTALTRAKRKVLIISDEITIEKMTKVTSRKVSSLIES